MQQKESGKKTILLASGKVSEMDSIESWLSPSEYRIIRAQNFLSLINSIYHYRVHLLIADVNLPDISMVAFLPFLREQFQDIKVIITMKRFHPDLERILRKYKILYVMYSPINGSLLASIVEKGLEKYERGLISA